MTDFSAQNELLTAKLLNQDCQHHILPKTYSKFYRRYFDLVSKFNVEFKSLLQKGLSEPEFYGDLVYKFRKKKKKKACMLAITLALNFVKSFFDI